MISKSFDRMLPNVDVDGLRNVLEEQIATKAKQSDTIALDVFSKGRAQDRRAFPLVGTYPPGLVGDVARFIYSASARPVAEIALTGAMGLLAGITGRAYNISGSGLNQYILLLSNTGAGKEAMSIGIDKLMASIRSQVPASASFIGPDEIRSDAALLKYLYKSSQCFVSQVGEFGKLLSQMSAPYAGSHHKGLMRVLIKLYQKSGQDQMQHATIYSDKENSTDIIRSPALTLLGESAPEIFYETLDENMITDGLLPRFLNVEYNGPRVPFNEDHVNAKPSFALIEQMATLTGHCHTLMHNGKVINVMQDEEGLNYLRSFNLFVDNEMNNGKQEVIRHLWNRAHLKALKLAALVAVGVNPFNPIITQPIAEWATSLVQTDTHNMIAKFQRGEVGKPSEESRQIAEVVKAMVQYVSASAKDLEKYQINKAMHNDKIIPGSFIQRRLVSMAAFRHDKGSATVAIKRTLQTLLDNGDIRELGRNDLAKYGFSGRAFMIVNVKMFL